MTNETRNDHGRAVVLTPPGVAAIAVVRLIGGGAGEFLHAHFLADPAAGRCVHGEIRDGEKTIDDVVVMLAQDGTFADVNLHGGPWVIHSFLEVLRREGLQIIEHVGQAIADDAVDGATMLQREMLAHLPLARTELALRVLLAQPQAWSAFINRQSAMGNGKSELQSILEDRSLHHLLYPPRVAIIGIPNVGKSTLANQLFAQERSITADVAGTTRDWVGEIANIDGLPIMLVDTPGLRQSSDPIESAAIGRSAEQIAQADLVLLVLDPTQPLEMQQPLLAAYPGAIRILNKSDLTPIWKRFSAGALRVVATSGEGVHDLRRSICEHFGCTSLHPHRPRWWTQRQRQILTRAISQESALAELLT